VGDVLRSRLLAGLGFRHGFNLRTGGTSQPPFSSFNLGRSVGDDPARVAENHGRFALAVGYPLGALYETSQAHGCAVCTVAPGDDLRAVRARGADALVTGPGAAAIGVRIADCVPVLLADVRSGAVSAIHAGWRGTVRGVVEAAAAALLETGSGDPAGLCAAIFPHIGPCCFEVGDDVAQSLLAASPDLGVVDRSRHKPHVDLRAIISAKLAALGVSAAQIEQVPGCTRCEPERFFSYRRDGQRSGRHLAAIVSR
jgi:YfiH family protein